jgi:hypothetical protein
MAGDLRGLFSRNIVRLPLQVRAAICETCQAEAGYTVEKGEFDATSWSRSAGMDSAFFALRALRFSYRIVSRMKRDFLFVRRNYDTIIGGTQVFVFLFVTTAIVYET